MWLAAQGGFQPLLDEMLPHPGDGGEADVEGLGDALVGPGGTAVGLVGLEQDAGMGQFAGRSLAAGSQVVEGLAFLGGQRHKVFLHRGFLPKEPHETRDSGTVQVNCGGPLVTIIIEKE